MSKDEIASLYATRAEQMDGVQLYRADGSPIVGALISHSDMAVKKGMIKHYKGKRVDCKLLCCSEKRMVDSGYTFNVSVDYSDSSNDYTPQPDQWIKVEHRSERRLRTRAKFARENDYTAIRPNVFYAMHDD